MRARTLFVVLLVALTLAAACEEPPGPHGRAGSGAATGAPGASVEGGTVAPTEGNPGGVVASNSGPLAFTDVTAASGIRFKHNSGANGQKYLPETMGAGCAFVDYDNDGWQDLFLVN